MESWSIIAFGFLVGMGHALEADHLAAVAALSARRSSRRDLVLRGLYWGTGHTIALFAICSIVVLAGAAISQEVEAALELAVGVMIVALGLHVLFTMRQRRIHFHVHDHGDGRHVHAHSHAGETASHRASAHAHGHAARPLRALVIGLLHGAAGSAGLLVLAVAAAKSAAAALAYVAVFGLGSILGMAALSLVVSYPLTALQRGAGWLSHATVVAIGGLALAIGGDLVLTSAGHLRHLLFAT